MKQTTLYVAASLAIALLLLQPPRVQSKQYQLQDFDQWLNRLRDSLSTRMKKSCVGYMCSYTHMGSAAAAKSRQKALMGFLRSCAIDPTCSPGKRRKRSVSSNRLSRSEFVKSNLPLKNLFPRIYSGLMKRDRKENVKSFISE